MPVWHELSKSWRESHDLVVLGIAQEQHPERCDLYARWQGFDWPILWDPFNLTEARAVPIVYAIDEAGMVRAIRPNPATFEAEFLERDFGAGAARPGDVAESSGTELVECAAHDPSSAEGTMWQALSQLLFADGAVRPIDATVGALRLFSAQHPEDARALFRLGVALRMRYDSAQRQGSDFQDALLAWSGALTARPNEYIWRRRIQQYGPALDKPYPFYPWVDEALAALVDRGEAVPVLSAALTQSERAAPQRRFVGAEDAVESDPEGAILRDDGGWLEVDTAVAHHTDAADPVARVHVAFRPRTDSGVHWNNEAEPLVVWFGDETLPDGWALGSQWVRVAGETSDVVSSEVRSAEVELRLPPGAKGTLSGYALFYACEDVDGVCTYLRRDFTVDVVAR